VAGAAALLLAARPSLTPDQVKSALMRSASPMPNFASKDQGAGRLRVDVALTTAPDPAFVQAPTSSGLGSIDASRGGRYVQAACGLIQGEIDVRCEPWNGSAWTGSAWTGSAWTGSAWTGSAWTGSAWTGSAWTGGTWTGSAWTGSAWTGSAWTGSAWTGSAWTGSAWTGSAWTGSAWTGSAWTGNTYDEDDVFATAWWGPSPPPGTVVPGEVSAPVTPAPVR
jgi:serine protease AprX